MNYPKKISLLCGLFLLFPGMWSFGSFMNPPGTEKNEVKAMFIYNFSKYFSWEEITSDADFVIAVFGNTEAAAYLNEISGRRQINGKTIIIKKVFSVTDLVNVQMLFIAGKNSHFIHEVNNSIDPGSIIIITENPGSAKNISQINLVNVKDKLGFELNETRLKEQNIKYSKELSSLAFKKY